MGNCIPQRHEISSCDYNTFINYKMMCFYRWALFTQSITSRKLKHELSQSHDRAALNYQRIIDMQDHIGNLEKKVNALNDDKQLHHIIAKTCCLCFEETESYVSCKNNHIHCDECMNKHCNEIFSKHSDEIAVKCASMNNCECFIPLPSLTKFESGNQLYCEKIHMDTMQMMSTIITESPENVSLKMKYLRHDGTYRAYACPNCGYGPIEHYHCDDLQEFHAKNGCDNACPSCQHFTKDISMYKIWTGP